MEEILLKEPFVPLTDFGIDSIRPFSVYGRFYEKEIARKNGGIDIGSKNLKELVKEIDEEEYRKLVPGFNSFEGVSLKGVKGILDKYKDFKPCAMKVKSVDEFQKHLAIVCQITHHHYILGMKNKKKFPVLSCGPSGRNVLFSLYLLGYPNAVYAYDKTDDHGYTLLPFVECFGNEKKKGLLKRTFHRSEENGVIIIDPTSDQLWDRLVKPRNHMLVGRGCKWTYKTDWSNGNNLFPTRIMDIDTIKTLVPLMELTTKGIYEVYHFFHKGGRKYLKKAFANPVDVEIECIVE